jgi:two-component system, chemotaxis family, protein-glutamate methylesterase/glutaminase
MGDIGITGMMTGGITGKMTDEITGAATARITGKTRVLVVEDSATVRGRLVEILGTDPAVEVIGEVADGKRAIEVCREARPDVITMDMMLPVMSGLAATEFIMAHCPTPILVVSASINRGELFRTYDSLAAGAVDVLEKPTGQEADGVWERNFLATVKRVARIRVIRHPRARLAGLNGGGRNQAAATRNGLARSCDVIAIGASTGGPGAIVEVLRGMPSGLRTPILIVQHINEPFGRGFADWLDGLVGPRVIYAADGLSMASAAGCAMVAPGGRHLVVRHGRLRLTLDPERQSCRPSVDVLFESVAAEYGRAAAACLLTGMGRDGARGLLKVREAGGFTIAQDQSTSVIYGMPREAIELGAAMEVLRLGDIGRRLGDLCGLPAGQAELPGAGREEPT